MKTSTRGKISVVMLILFLAFIGCAGGMGIKLDTPEKKYLGARAELNLLLEQYEPIQNKISDADHERAKVAFTSADDTLDIWEAMILAGDTDYDFSNNLSTWLKAKSVIIEVLRTVTK